MDENEMFALLRQREADIAHLSRQLADIRAAKKCKGKGGKGK